MTKLNYAYIRCQEFLRRLIEDESGQGATEYILLLVVVVAIALIFKNQIQQIVTSKIQEVSGSIGSFNVGAGSGTN
jgi:Flp pilus assembly pilin Flp